MKNILKSFLFSGLILGIVLPVDTIAATTKAKKQSALQAGTKVRAKVEADGVYDENCYNKYFGCMDQFCIADNESGGSCMCSDDAAKYEEQLESIKKILTEAERISTEEVEKIQAGANADIIFNGGERVYNDDGSVVKAGEKKKGTEDITAGWTSIYDTEDEEEEIWEEDDWKDKVGRDLYESAHGLCKAQMPESCNKDMTLLTKMYSRQIVSDCKGLANSIDQKKQEADSALNQAKAAVRGALKESFEEANLYDRGTCMVEYKKCMQTNDACGPDWENCVFTIASENMQNNKAENVAGTKVKTVNTYSITPSTMEILEGKRFICEKVLDKCVAVRDLIWNDFLRDAAPTIRLAESNIESKKRQSCLGDISNCIQKACKDDIVGKGEATMDACLARPDMARSFCKIQIEPCERMEPQIWDYVVSKLAAMRVDACTQEVKDCFTSEDRCGKDFSNCIGMDYSYIHDICPIDKLVVCKQANPKFQMSDLDSMLMGLYLNIDNQALDNCQNIAENKMVELCGSTTDCNKFASDEFIGTGSIKSQKDGTIYRVTGMISFGSIKMGDASGGVKDGDRVLAPGEIGVQDYIKSVRASNEDSEMNQGIISSIEEELNNIAGTINRAVSLIESDQRVQYCINGRDLSQINGKDNKNGENTTVARFPKLLNQYRVAIGMAALRKAQDNYNKKWSAELSKAMKDASVDVAQYMCQMLPTGTGSIGLAEADRPLTPPYAISYEIANGVSMKDLTRMEKSITKYDSASMNSTNVCVACLSGSKINTEIPGGTKSQWATFNRETRTCRLCTEMVTRECKQTGASILFIDTRKMSCGEEKREENCDDIPM
nr:hypothetical protein [Candidatus Enterousia merdequi]